MVDFTVANTTVRIHHTTKGVENRRPFFISETSSVEMRPGWGTTCWTKAHHHTPDIYLSMKKHQFTEKMDNMGKTRELGIPTKGLLL